MAVDLRVPADSAERAFIEKSLLAMERAGVLDVTRERSPAHYHIAVFAEAYAPFAAREDSLAAIERTRVAVAESAVSAAAAAPVHAPVPSSDDALPDLLLGVLVVLAVTAPIGYRMWSDSLIA